MSVNRAACSMAQWCVVSMLDHWNDEELLAAVVARDLAALRELYRRHEPWLSVRLGHRCADAAAVEEAVQDTFVAVWRTAHRHDGSGTVAAWIWGIGIRSLLQRIRPRRNLVAKLMTQRSVDVRSAEEELLVAVEHSDVGAALGRLSPELRAVVQATVIDGLTCNEAGRLLGIPSGTVKTRMMRARHELRQALT